jgi:hypothetical protein
MPPAASPPGISDLREVVKQAVAVAWCDRDRPIQTASEGGNREAGEAGTGFRLVKGGDSHMVAGVGAYSTSSLRVNPRPTIQTNPHYTEALRWPDSAVNPPSHPPGSAVWYVP